MMWTINARENEQRPYIAPKRMLIFVLSEKRVSRSHVIKAPASESFRIRRNMTASLRYFIGKRTAGRFSGLER